MKSSCDWRQKRSSSAGKPPRRIMRHKGDNSWTGVKTERYKLDDGTWSSVIRRTLIGEGSGKGLKFHIRYFEVAPGGHTTLERHWHEHVVVGIKGKGICRIGKRKYNVGFLDTLYVPPDEVHRLENPYGAPFGFFCIVNSKRDRPVCIAE